VVVGNITFFMIFAISDAWPFTQWINCSFFIIYIPVLVRTFAVRRIVITPTLTRKSKNRMPVRTVSVGN